MKIVTLKNTDIVSVFGTMDNPTNIDIRLIAHKEDASEYVGLAFTDTIPSECTVITEIPIDTYYFFYKPVLGYWLTKDLISSVLNDYRNAETDNIIVTVDGIFLDGDEDSQTRMTRAQSVMNDTITTEWEDVNGDFRALTKAQFIEAITLAGQEQTALWLKYSI